MLKVVGSLSKVLIFDSVFAEPDFIREARIFSAVCFKQVIDVVFPDKKAVAVAFDVRRNRAERIVFRQIAANIFGHFRHENTSLKSIYKDIIIHYRANRKSN